MHLYHIACKGPSCFCPAWSLAHLVGDLLVDMELEWKGLKMMGHSWDGQQVLWHSTVLYRLRFISFVAESFWSLAFKERRGLNQLDASSVSSVVLSDVEVGGKS